MLKDSSRLNYSQKIVQFYKCWDLQISKKPFHKVRLTDISNVNNDFFAFTTIGSIQLLMDVSYDRYDKTVSKMKEDLFTWCPFFKLDLTWATWRCPAGSRDCLLFRSTWVYTRFFGGVHFVHLFLVFNVVSVLFLSCPYCSPEFVSNCWFPLALNIPLVFLYFSYSICVEPSQQNYFSLYWC